MANGPKEVFMATNDRNQNQGSGSNRTSSGDMSVREAGQMGGEVRKEQLGPDGYSELGRQGVEALREQRGPDAMSEIGREGGQIRKQQLGPEGYSELGQKGGQRVSDLVEKGKQSEGRDS
jgi:general stress protein YciG